MSNLNKKNFLSYLRKPITREETYIREPLIKENYKNNNLIFNNTMNHQVKIKDTKKTIFPVAGSFNNKNILISTTSRLKLTKSVDTYRTSYYNKKKDLFKKFMDDMIKAGMVKKKFK